MNFYSSIANQFPGKFLVCKSPVEDFNNGSILTVNPGEYAIFVNCGQIVGTFAPGRYELTTQNYPFLNAFRRFLANGELTYHCAIFFVSETQSCEVLWGFPLPVRDPVQNIYTRLLVRGSYTVRVSDGAKLLTTLMGMNVNFMAAPDVKAFFGNKFQQHISNSLAQYITQGKRELLDICYDTITVSESISEKLGELVAYSGLEVFNFSIAAMNVDENDPNRRILEQAYARAREREIMGEHYSAIKETEIRTNASQTPFAGVNFAPAPQAPAPAPAPAPPAPAPAPPAPAPPAPPAPDATDFYGRLKQLHDMLEAKLISEEDYKQAKSDIIKQMM